MDRLQRSEGNRPRLQSGWEIYRAAVEDRVIGADGIDLLARCMQELGEEGLVAYRTVSGGACRCRRSGMARPFSSCMSGE